MKLIRALFRRFAEFLVRGGDRAWLFALIAVAAPAQAAPPEVSARAAVVMNAGNGEVLYAKDPHRRLPPASTTKVLTTLLALERLDANARVRVSASAAVAVPSRVGLQPGEIATVQDLLYGVMLKSGNDAAEVIAEAIGDSLAGFARIMNARAQQLGARNSYFSNPHGLPGANHYSSAYDLALIFEQAMRNPRFAEIAATRNALLRVAAGRQNPEPRLVRVHNSNRLLNAYPGASGGKTGYTHAAGRCYVGEVRRGRLRLIVAVLGSDALWEDVVRLFDYGFAHYDVPVPGSLIASSIIRDLDAERTRPGGTARGRATADGWVWESDLDRIRRGREVFLGGQD